MVGEKTDTKTILVVEDERSLAAAITKKLELNGFETALANSVDSAVKLLKTKRVDAIWLDHYLIGNANGIDFIKLIKADDTWCDIPVYAVSNTASDDKVKTYTKLGINKFYVKSNHRLDEIISAIRSSLAKEK